MPTSIADRAASVARRVEDLREVVGLLRSLNSDAARRVADALTQRLVVGGGLDDLLGLPDGPAGGRALSASAARRANRDALIRAHAKRIGAGLSPSAAARRLVAEFAGSPDLRRQFEVLGTEAPLSVRHVRRIIGAPTTESPWDTSSAD